MVNYGGQQMQVMTSVMGGSQPVMPPMYVIPQSMNTIIDGHRAYLDWYGIPVQQPKNYHRQNIEMKMWEFQDFRRQLEAVDCETILVVPQGYDPQSYTVFFSDMMKGYEFDQWFLALKKEVHIILPIPRKQPPEEIHQWMKNSFAGQFTFTHQNHNNMVSVYIRDPREAFHFKTRWTLPLEEFEEA